jgi:hypothetical protein
MHRKSHVLGDTACGGRDRRCDLCPELLLQVLSTSAGVICGLRSAATGLVADESRCEVADRALQALWYYRASRCVRLVAG